MPDREPPPPPPPSADPAAATAPLGGAAPPGADRSPRLRPGELLAGRFRVVRFLAAGGMGEVYEAVDTELSEPVAVKTLKPELGRDARVVERFRRELMLARRVAHPGVCRTFDLFRHRGPEGGELVFLTMELLRGETLADRVARGALPLAEALPLVEQVVSALSAAHAAGVVHRDFKTANVMLVPAGSGAPEGQTRAVVTDFGLARAWAETASTLTEDGNVLGTATYVAPEQLTGGEVTPAVDVYALGVVLFEMATGRVPFQGDSPLATAMMRLSVERPSPRVHVPDLDPRWEAVILRCLEREPARRFASVADVARALAGERVAPAPRRLPRRQALLGAGLALAGLLALGLGTWAVWRSAPPPPAPGASSLQPRRAVAVLGPASLSGKPEVAWIATAVSEMLGAELSAGGRLRLVPGENVARLAGAAGGGRADSASGTAAGPEALARLGRRLGSDVVVEGAYLAQADVPEARLRIDLRARETATGEVVASATETGTVGELIDLVPRLGASLRGQLGAGAAPAVGRPARPRSAEAARLLAEGLSRLRAFDALEAQERLARAAAADPDNPLPRAALAEAWSALGHDARAEAEARAAFDLSSGLGEPERSLVEGRWHEASRQWAEAARAYRGILARFPDDVEAGLRLAAAETAGGRGREALATVALLRRSGALREDPRLDLAEAEAADATGDFRRELDAAMRAARGAEALSARLVAAQAAFLRARAQRGLGDLGAAARAATEAQDGFEAAGDRSGVARAVNLSGLVSWARGDLAGARRAYERALAIGRDIGERRRTQASLNNLAILDRREGQLGRALARYEEALAITREVQDRRAEAVILNNVTAILMAQGRLAEVERTLGTALEAVKAVGDREGGAMVLANLAGVAIARGALDAASSRAAEAAAVASSIGSRTWAAFARGLEGQVLLERDDREGARRALEEARAVQRELGERDTAAESAMFLARLRLEEGEAAADLAREAAEAYVALGDATREAQARAVLAQALLVAGRLAEARAEAGRARSLARSGHDLATAVNVAVAEGRVLAAAGRGPEARATLQAALDQATRAGWVPLRFEARLALAEALRAPGQPAPAREGLRTLTRDAEDRGYRLWARRAREAGERR